MAVEIPEEVMLNVLSSITTNPFSVIEFSEVLKDQHPELWATLVEQYGAGGRGAGSRFSAFGRLASALKKLERRGLLRKDGNHWADPDLQFGSVAITRWTTDAILPEEIETQEALIEGAVTSVTVNRYERNLEARRRCLEHYDFACIACGFDFGKRYGDHGRGFIHVHHLIPLSEIGEAYEIDPINDLVPVCPNCHAMLHRSEPALTIEELKAILAANAS